MTRYKAIIATTLVDYLFIICKKTKTINQSIKQSVFYIEPRL